MNFSEAFKLMKQGAKIQLPSWKGYWYWSKEEQTIIIHEKNGLEMDIRETQYPDYTFSNIASEEWEVSNRKVMISQPMLRKSKKEIKATREKAIKVLKEKGYEVVNAPFTEEWDKMEERGVVQIPLCLLAKSLENMSLCHVVYFCKGWENTRGCRIEHDAALAYGLEAIYEE